MQARPQKGNSAMSAFSYLGNCRELLEYCTKLSSALLSTDATAPNGFRDDYCFARFLKLYEVAISVENVD